MRPSTPSTTQPTSLPCVLLNSRTPDMSLVAELPGIVDDAAIAPSNTDGILLLDEQSGMRIQVLASTPVLAIRLGNEGVGHVPRLNLHAGLNLICDYLVLVESGDVTHAVLVELKATWEPRAREQVRRSPPILEYLRAVCEVNREAPFGDATIETGYLVICGNRRLNKQTTRAEPVGTVRSRPPPSICCPTTTPTTRSAARRACAGRRAATHPGRRRAAHRTRSPRRNDPRCGGGPGRRAVRRWRRP